jgi:hypothetical protein
MLTTRLVKVIKDHRDAISEAIIRQMHRDPNLNVIHGLPDSVIRSWGDNIIESFRIWAVDADHELCADRCYTFGKSRCEEQIPLLELIRAFHICRERVVSYIRGQGFEHTSLDIYIEEETEHHLAGFFDFATYHTVRAYEDARQLDETVRENLKTNTHNRRVKGVATA